MGFFVQVRSSYSFSSRNYFLELDSEKKERLIPQTPSIRGRNHSHLGDTTTYGDFNGKITVTLFFTKVKKKMTHCGKKLVSLRNMSQMLVGRPVCYLQSPAIKPGGVKA